MISKISRSKISQSTMYTIKICKNYKKKYWNGFFTGTITLVKAFSFFIGLSFYQAIYSDFFDSDYFLLEQLPCVGELSSNSRGTPSSASFILDLLNQIGAKDIIKHPLFKHTNPLVTRSVLDLPLFNDAKPVKRRDVVPKKLMGVTPFYAHIQHTIFHHKGDDLKDYLALDEESLISALHEVFASLNQFSDQFYFDIKKVFNALKNGSVEQRRAGLLFSCEGSLGECSVSGSIPLYYLERNYQLTNKEKRALEEEFGVSTKKQQDQFKKDHLIGDKFGLGDMRIKIALPFTESWKDHFDVIFLMTVPFGGSFTKGILGNSFVGSATIPTLDMESLFELIIADKQEEAFAVLSGLGLNALDRLSAVLLEQSLTNERHFSLGVGVVNKLKLKDFFKNAYLKRWYWNYSLTLEYVVPSKHHRSFISKIDNELIDSLDLTNPEDPVQTLQIFTQEALDRIFLRSFKAKVHPGVVVRSYSTFVYKYKAWHVWVGSDLWFKSPEKVLFLQASSAVQQSLDRRKVKDSYGLALSTLFGFSYTYYKEDVSTLDIGLNAYSTYCSRGVGQEIGLALKCSIYF